MAAHIDARTMDQLKRRLQQRRTELVRQLAGPEAPAVKDVSEGREAEDEADLASTEVLDSVELPTDPTARMRTAATSRSIDCGRFRGPRLDCRSRRQSPNS
jgi:hypothetical protein